MKKIILALTFYFLGHDFFAQNYNVTLRAQLPYPGQTLANICGYVDSTGKEYALLGASNGMSIVDVSDPDNPFEVTQIPYNNVIPGYALWKEIKVYKNYAYITSEAGAGLQIVDLRHLPDSTNFPSKYYTGDGAIDTLLNRVHALHIDTSKKFVYLFGSTLLNGGAVVLDITDPWNPVYTGGYSNFYVHDGYVDNDTLYAANIYNGFCSVIDMSNKTSPVTLASFQTPHAFPHNTWPDVEKKTLFTTDEVSNSFLTAYDISDLNNITELDRIRTSDTNSVVHNTHIVNDYAVSSWYTEGFTIVDVTYPYNMVEVGKYDTYGGTSTTFAGAWGVYPFLPSGTIVVSNINEGLFVLSPTYVRAAYLEGLVQDSSTNANLNGVLVEILGSAQSDITDAVGKYAAGVATAGNYNIQFSKPGYQTRIINNISLQNGVVTTLNVKLLDAAIGAGELSNPKSFLLANGNPFTNSCNISYFLQAGMHSASVEIFDASGKLLEKKILTNAAGNFSVGGEYAEGVYFVSLRTSDGVIAPVRIVKMK
jgi:choice-of-anchor B domain-containing protein